MSNLTRARDLQQAAGVDAMVEVVIAKARLKPDAVMRAALRRAVIEIAFLAECRFAETVRILGLDGGLEAADRHHEAASARARDALIAALNAKEQAA